MDSKYGSIEPYFCYCPQWPCPNDIERLFCICTFLFYLFIKKEVDNMDSNKIALKLAVVAVHTLSKLSKLSTSLKISLFQAVLYFVDLLCAIFTTSVIQFWYVKQL